MHLLMKTYRQDIISNFGCVCVIDLLYLLFFQGRFPKYTQVYLSTKVFMLKNNFTAVSFKSNTTFSVILI